jgi:cysteinyl-tRNA synthetase, unknown class
MNFKLLIIFAFTMLSCSEPSGNLSPNKSSFKDEMRNLVVNLSKNAKSKKTDFSILTQNALELLLSENSQPYINAIDGQAIEALFYGYNTIDKLNTKAENDYKNKYLSAISTKSTPIFAIDYCISEATIKDSYVKNAVQNNKIYIASSKLLNLLPPQNLVLYSENKNNITKIDDVKNFVLLSTNENYNNKSLVDGLINSNYDLAIINPFIKTELIQAADIKAIKAKKNGGKRLVFAIINVTEADSKLYYWQTEWRTKLPSFAGKEIGLLGNFRTNYWQPDWQAIISGNDKSIINQLIVSGFDGAYLVGLDAYELYE